MAKTGPPSSPPSSSSSASSRPPCYLLPSLASSHSAIPASATALTVLGGKASCRRKFVMEVQLLDGHGDAVRDLPGLPVVATLTFADDHSPASSSPAMALQEPPLFTTFHGVEFPSHHAPTLMAEGKASFKLAISLLSSKCDNRLFSICFTTQPAICPPCFSIPIRSISRKRSTPSRPSPEPPAQTSLHSPTSSSPACCLNRKLPAADILRRLHHLCAAARLDPPITHPLASILLHASLRTEESLDDEERAIRLVELVTREIGREVERRKEEIRSERRRLVQVEDEARLRSIFMQQSSPWMMSSLGSKLAGH